MTERPDEEVAAELMRRIEAASTTRLGDIATVHAGPEPEVDALPWDDAATWEAPREPEGRIAQLTREQLDDLFADPDEQLGTVQDMGWFGLVCRDVPGGYVLRENDQGFRDATEYETDETLQTRWDAIQTEYGSWYEEREAYEQATEEPEETHSGLKPRIYVADLAAYNGGALYGAWFNATLEADELEAATRFMLRGSPEAEAEETAIHDHDDFAGWHPDEYTPLSTVSRVAKGIAEYGEAFGHFVELVGTDNEQALDNFGDHYRGKYESMKAYVEEYLDEIDADRWLRDVPEDLRHYVEFDTDAMARDWESDMHVVEASGGGVFIFDTRM